ncbi:helix-turn-helix transcriptional regulator [bacterium]|nr:helix-turn-helix transcriptional regulator [bacterium]
MSENLRIKLGARIKKLRIARNLTQAELAEIAGIDYKYLQRIEGKNTPDLKIDTIHKIAKALKTTPAKLLEL